MRKASKSQVIIEGYSRGLWTSLAVKSLRMGWPEGLRQAEKRAGPSMVQATLLCGIFEDIFPAADELAMVVREVKKRQFDALCSRETHHSQFGLTEEFCALEIEAVEAATNRKPEVWAIGRELGIWLPPRSLNCVYTWAKLKDKIIGGRTRPIDETPWSGVPEDMADAHTAEGREARRFKTVLSGHYDVHLKLAHIVQSIGWAELRRGVHEAPQVPFGLVDKNGRISFG